MGSLRELDRSVERRWPWFATWGTSAAAQARWVLAMGAVGLVASFVFYSAGDLGSAWASAALTASAALGSLFQVERQLAKEQRRNDA